MKSVSQMRLSEHSNLFPRLSPESVKLWHAHGQVAEVEDGTRLLAEGDAHYPFLILLSGTVQVVKQLGRQEIVLAVHEANDFVGEVTILAGSACPATAIARGRTKLLVIQNEVFRALVAQGDQEAVRIVRALAVRSAEIGAIGRHKEKLASIGRIAAGLAHELNNPAAAISRQAATLRDEIIRNQRLILSATGTYSPQQEEAILSTLCLKRTAKEVDSLWLQDNNDQLEAWLTDLGVQGASLYAANLSDAGFTVDLLGPLQAQLGELTAPALQWIGNTLILLSASTAIQDGSRRISDILGRMRHYSHVDQSPMLEIDLHKEIDATLSVLVTRLTGVAVHRDYCSKMPRISAFAGELNQVWTNLIENAVDAMPHGGTLRISTSCDDTHASVEIADTGVGVKEEIQDCIFDPFFTTKDVGEGFGLGLDYAYRTVVRRHAGDIQFVSQPGDTRFRVHLPFAQDALAVSL